MIRESIKWSPRGSAWHRWDPHMHAPGTLLNDQFKESDWSVYISKINQSVPRIRALGVTDYFCIETYKSVQSLFNENKLPHVDVIFPNVEIRLDIKTATQTPINLHLLFSPNDPNHVSEIERVLSFVGYEYREKTYKCTPNDLVELGKAFNTSQKDHHAAMAEGARQFKITFGQLKDMFRTEVWLRENCLVAVSGKSNDGTAGLQKDHSYATTREEIERFSHFVFSSSPIQRDFWLGKRSGHTPDSIESKYGSLKPCLHGSDAHSSESVGKPALERFCWIKGDLDFESLRQTTLEPEKRVWIGNTPPDDEHDVLCITGVTTIDAPWHRNETIQLNRGLVTIIGSRGSGKTALVDIIATGATSLKKPDDSSFLLRASQPTNLLGSSRVTLSWNDGSEPKPLFLNPNEKIDESETERIRYLPQNFVDRLCSATGLAIELREEMERVVYEATSPTDRLETDSFSQLSETYLRPLRTNREELIKEIHRISDKIVALDAKNTRLPQLKQNKTQLLKLIERKKGLKNSLIPKGYESRARKLAKLEQLCANKEVQIGRLKRRLRNLSHLSEEVRNIIQTKEPARFQDMMERYDVAELADSQWHEFAMNFKGDPESVCHKAVEGTQREISILYDGDPNRIIDIEKTPHADLPLILLVEQRDSIKKEVGIDTVKQNQYNEIAEQIKTKESDLRRISEEIIKAAIAKEQSKQHIISRRDAYANVFQTFVDEEHTLSEIYAPLKAGLSSGVGSLSKLEFTVKRHVDLDSWVDKGEKLLDLRKSSKFQGLGSLRSEAETSLFSAWQSGGAQLVSRAMDTFRNDNYIEFIKAIPSSMVSEDQSKSKWNQSIANWLYDTTHISISYNVTYDGTAIEQLSPGTRGIVLLLIYLVIDKHDYRPLVIDQPEENLDPNSVFLELVPHFREASKRRQVIIVTHNANLVVNTDSDQVIIAESNQNKENALPNITYTTGSLENPGIRGKVCDILEGGKRAFMERERRYRLRWQNELFKSDET